jgi:predicted helicase
MLDIKPNHKAIKEYYLALDIFEKQGISHETAVRNAFQSVLVHCCKQMNLDFIEEYPYKRLERYKAHIDGAFLDNFRVPQGYWEAKDSQDDLAKEVLKKFEQGYPKDNIIFQSPERAIIYQGSTKVLDDDITSPDRLVWVLKQLFQYKTDTQMDWEQAVEEFKQRIPESAEKIIELIEEERKSNKAFINSFETFTSLCKTSINPNISIPAIEEMLVQHLLTERIFRKVFDNPDFVNKNIIANEIEKVITSLTSRKFIKSEFFKPLDRFYTVLEKRAQNIDDYSIKQTFLNTVYEKFFQGFAIKQADTLGIVYTPQPIVDFMVESVDEILKREFGRSLSSPNVHILDPFTGTGNFITNIMRKINKTDLKHKYLNELHCNEIMLLPYYIASMNIEHQYYELTGEYIPFQGICLVDTFQLAESSQFNMFTEENTERVEKLKQTPIFVYIGNPPYNAGQANENDNNKNRKYPVIDKHVSETFAKDSKATNKNMLQDPYIKAFRFAMDKIIERGEGIVAYVTNNSFIDGIALDGMRKHLEQNFDKIYVYNLKGNVRQNPKISGTTHNVFGIQVGVSINILIKKKEN